MHVRQQCTLLAMKHMKEALSTMHYAYYISGLVYGMAQTLSITLTTYLGLYMYVTNWVFTCSYSGGCTYSTPDTIQHT